MNILNISMTPVSSNISLFYLNKKTSIDSQKINIDSNNKSTFFYYLHSINNNQNSINDTNDNNDNNDNDINK